MYLYTAISSCGIIDTDKDCTWRSMCGSHLIQLKDNKHHSDSNSVLR